MSAHPPPVPPDQRPKHGGDPEKADVAGSAPKQRVRDNPDQLGQTAATKQNTTNKGLQQDR